MKSVFILSKEQESQIRKLLAQLFFAFSRQNWIRGNSLGMARHVAIKQIESYLETKDKKVGPVMEFLKEYFGSNKNFMYKLTLETKNTKTSVDLPKHVCEAMKNNLIKIINKTLRELGNIIDESERKTKTILKYGLVDIIAGMKFHETVK